MSRNLLRALVALLLASLSAVSVAKDSRMVPADAPGAAPADAAIVVFMRPSALGAAIKSTVYDVTDGKQEFIGIVSYKDKVAYVAKPGKHLFMVVAENGDFLDAELEAGKTYYVVISPRYGVWKARFGFRPVRNDPNAEPVVRRPPGRRDQEEGQVPRQVERAPGFRQGLPVARAWRRDLNADEPRCAGNSTCRVRPVRGRDSRATAARAARYLSALTPALRKQVWPRTRRTCPDPHPATGRFACRSR
jgi:hypothetical protein